MAKRGREKKGVCELEKAAGCGKRSPPADLRWLFSQVAKAGNARAIVAAPGEPVADGHNSSLLFEPLPAAGSEGISLLDQQTYRQWRSFIGQQRLSHPRRLRQRTMIIQPFTSPSLPGYSIREVDSSVLEHLQHFCTAFFSGMTIDLASPVDLTTLPSLTSRVHKDTQRVQYLVGDIIRFLEHRRPRHAQCVMAVTSIDLYPSPEWNFVLGHASLTSGCGVFGFGRYFNSQFASSGSAPTTTQQLGQLWVLARVISHELCHTLGMKHCYYFQCAMNESSSIEQAAAQPLFLCPVCLRKLKKLLRFDIFKRYDLLQEALGTMLAASQPNLREKTEFRPNLLQDSVTDVQEISRPSKVKGAISTAGNIKLSDDIYADGIANKERFPTERSMHNHAVGDSQGKTHAEELQVDTEKTLINGLLVQGVPSFSNDHSLCLQQALQWLDRAKETQKNTFN